MTVTVLLFAGLRDLAGADAVTVPDAATVADLRRELARAYPAMASLLGRSAVAVDYELVGDGAAIPPAGEVAVLPPVSGVTGWGLVTAAGRMLDGVSHARVSGVIH